MPRHLFDYRWLFSLIIDFARFFRRLLVIFHFILLFDAERFQLMLPCCRFIS